MAEFVSIDSLKQGGNIPESSYTQHNQYDSQASRSPDLQWPSPDPYIPRQEVAD